MADEEKQKCPPCPQGLPGWLQTFGDLMSLLLTFFVLLLSFANTDLIKYKEALGSIKDAFGVSVEEPGEFEGKSPNPLALEVPAPKTRVIKKEIIDKVAAKTTQEQQQAVKSLAQDVKDAVAAAKMDKAMDVAVEGGKVRVKAPDKIFFKSGKATLRKIAYRVLKRFGVILKKQNFDLVVEGHSDKIPIKGSKRFPSNWELSAARAAAVIRYFVDKHEIAPIRLKAVGYAFSRPIAPNKTRAGRAKNRRVEFVFVESSRPKKFYGKETDLEQKDVF